MATGAFSWLVIIGSSYLLGDKVLLCGNVATALGYLLTHWLHNRVFEWLGLVMYMVALTRLARRLHKSGWVSTPILLEQAAIEEELWYRQGSEYWSTWQRLKSCVLFGVVHETRLFSAFWLRAVPAAIGGSIMMYEYLRVYRSTDSRRAAIKAASGLHCQHNAKWEWYITWPILAVWVVTLVLGTL